MKSIILYVSIILCVTILSPTVYGTQNRITFWTTEMEAERLKIQRKIARAFTIKTGIRIHIVPVQENLLAKKIIAANTTKTLPDVIYHPIDFTASWIKMGILDVQSAAEIINRLGKETFSAGSLNLVRFPGGYAGVPVDGWHQLLLYRKDLFEKNGLPAPARWDYILQAAKALHNPPLIWGFITATDPEEIYTQQVFEHFALSNGTKLLDSAGNIDLDTPEMIQTLEFYKALTRFTPRGDINWLHTRKHYISGRAAMIIWSPFILDELSWFYDDLPVIPDIIKGEPGYLARNTGFISVIHGPNGAAQYGQINYLGITRDADNAPAKQWVEFLLSSGYLKWLSMAAEGKLPMRKGTRHDPNFFVDGWIELEFGKTTKARISAFYRMDTMNVIIDNVNDLDNWGFNREKGALISKVYETKVLPRLLKRFLDGEMDAGQTARMINEQVNGLE